MWQERQATIQLLLPLVEPDLSNEKKEGLVLANILTQVKVSKSGGPNKPLKFPPVLKKWNALIQVINLAGWAFKSNSNKLLCVCVCLTDKWPFLLQWEII